MLFALLKSGKRRAEYFPIRHFGFLGARKLAVNARRRMERHRSEVSKAAQLRVPWDVGGGASEAHGVPWAPTCGEEEPNTFPNQHTRDTGVNDLWNKYVLEAIQRGGSPTARISFCTKERSFASNFMAIGSSAAADGCSPKHSGNVGCSCFVVPASRNVQRWP